MEFKQRCTAYRERVNLALNRLLPPADLEPARLHEAMRYAVLSGGKRMRPLLVYGVGEALGQRDHQLDVTACAVEIIHAYSLIHDDLPAMDDDDLRRGRPTCHMAFDEATAILAGDALQALAFEVLARGLAEMESGTPALAAQVTTELARACGSKGMAGGQCIDLAAVGSALDLAALKHMHSLKTGALIRVSVRLPALLCAAGAEDALNHASDSENLLTRLDRFGHCIGLAFQIRDDILDVEGDEATLGKTPGADAARDKPTFPQAVGLDESWRLARELRDEAIACLATMDERAGFLRSLARYVVERDS